MARDKDFDLAAALGRPGFTPSVKDAAALVELVVRGDEPAATKAKPALAGLGAAATAAIGKQLRAVDDGAAARLVAVLGLVARAGESVARGGVLEALDDARPRVRRAAIVALGKLGGEDARDALVARWDAGDMAPEERRALAEALGKLGGEAAMTRLQKLDASADGELARRRDRAILMTTRDAAREAESSVDIDAPPPWPLTVRLHAKSGLEKLLAEELEERGIALHGYTGPWRRLYASRLWASAGIRMPLDGDAPADIVHSILASRPLLTAWTRGPIRWRLGFASGHRRAVVWQVARDVTAAAPELINDPTSTTWDILVDTGAIEIVPKKADDPRFAYRVADVPASSHPTVAAALARVAAPRDGERVWDPFCGAGLELAECAQLARCHLFGSDIDDEALAAARTNLAGIDAPATLARGDARSDGPERVDLVITNPPLGSRVHVDAALLLVEALPNLIRRMSRGGRLVWITPSPRRTGPRAMNLGLQRTFDTSVDLGGVRGVLERWVVPSP